MLSNVGISLQVCSRGTFLCAEWHCRCHAMPYLNPFKTVSYIQHIMQRCYKALVQSLLDNIAVVGAAYQPNVVEQRLH